MGICLLIERNHIYRTRIFQRFEQHAYDIAELCTGVQRFEFHLSGDFHRAAWKLLQGDDRHRVDCKSRLDRVAMKRIVVALMLAAQCFGAAWKLLQGHRNGQRNAHTTRMGGMGMRSAIAILVSASLCFSQTPATISVNSGPAQYNLQAGAMNLMDGDTFFNATCPGDGTTYVQIDDTSGFGMGTSASLYLGKFTSNASPLIGTMVNAMTGYGSSGGVAKASGLTCIPAQAGGDVMFMWVLQQQVSGSFCQTSGGLIKSYDHGATWTNWTHPMNSGLANGDPPSPITTNMFTTYNSSNQFNAMVPVMWASGGGTSPGTDGQGSYVYFVAGLAACATPSTQMLLLRVARSVIENMSQADYQVYTGGDGNSSANWSSTLTNAVSVLTNSNVQFPSTMMCGLPGCLYVMSYYPNSMDATTLQWDWFVAPHPWGPFTQIRTDTWTPTALKLPLILAPSVAAGLNTTATILSTGNYQSASTCQSNPSSGSCYYQIWQTFIALSFVTGSTPQGAMSVAGVTIQ